MPRPGRKEEKVDVIGQDRERPYWQEKGWKKFNDINDTYEGCFVTTDGRWKGTIEKGYLNRYAFYIFDPPKALRESNHWACFRNKGMGKYFIHFSRKPKDVSSGIITVEQLLSESFREQRKKQRGKRPWRF